MSVKPTVGPPDMEGHTLCPVPPPLFFFQFCCFLVPILPTTFLSSISSFWDPVMVRTYHHHMFPSHWVETWQALG